MNDNQADLKSVIRTRREKRAGTYDLGPGHGIQMKYGYSGSNKNQFVVRGVKPE